MARRIVDISNQIRTGHFRWPVEQKLLRSHAEGSTFQVTHFGAGVHGFTHMDAARHFVPGGPAIEDVPLENVLGPACIVDLAPVEPNEAITAERLEAAGAPLEPGDIALLRSNWDQAESLDTPEFWTRAPYMTADACHWLRDKHVRSVGFDFPQDYCIRDLATGDREPAREENTTHVELLERGITLIEYLCNLSAIRLPRVEFIGLPLKLTGADGSPIRAVVLEEG